MQRDNRYKRRRRYATPPWVVCFGFTLIAMIPVIIAVPVIVSTRNTIVIVPSASPSAAPSAAPSAVPTVPPPMIPLCLMGQVVRDNGPDIFLRSFGRSVAIYNDTAVVGSSTDDTVGFNYGAVFVYQNNGTHWVETAKLLPPTSLSTSFFGTAVAIDKDIIVTSGLSAGTSQHGAVYVFEKNGTSWVLTDTVTADPLIEDENFGENIAISADTLVVGVPASNRFGPSYTGAVFVYRREVGGMWNLEALLVPDDLIDFDGFGDDVDVDGDTFITVSQSRPVAYVFHRQGTNWTQQASLPLPPQALTPLTVALDGDTAIVGSRDTDLGMLFSVGEAYIFERMDGNWTLTQNVTTSMPMSGDSFANSIDIDGDSFIAGMIGRDEGSFVIEGAACVFTKMEGTWEKTFILNSTDEPNNIQFGSSVAVSDFKYVVGTFAPEAFQAAYIYEECK